MEALYAVVGVDHNSGGRAGPPFQISWIFSTSGTHSVGGLQFHWERLDHPPTGFCYYIFERLPMQVRHFIVSAAFHAVVLVFLVVFPGRFLGSLVFDDKELVRSPASIIHHGQVVHVPLYLPSTLLYIRHPAGPQKLEDRGAFNTRPVDDYDSGFGGDCGAADYRVFVDPDAPFSMCGVDVAAHFEKKKKEHDPVQRLGRSTVFDMAAPF